MPSLHMHGWVCWAQRRVMSHRRTHEDCGRPRAGATSLNTSPVFLLSAVVLGYSIKILGQPHSSTRVKWLISGPSCLLHDNALNHRTFYVKQVLVRKQISKAQTKLAVLLVRQQVIFLFLGEDKAIVLLFNLKNQCVRSHAHICVFMSAHVPVCLCVFVYVYVCLCVFVYAHVEARS